MKSVRRLFLPSLFILVLLFFFSRVVFATTSSCTAPDGSTVQNGMQCPGTHGLCWNGACTGGCHHNPIGCYGGTTECQASGACKLDISPIPTPTGTPGVSGTAVTLNLTAHLYGIDNENLGGGQNTSGTIDINNPTRNAILTFYTDKGSTKPVYSLPTTLTFSSTDDNFENKLFKTKVPAGTYYVAIRFPYLTTEDWLSDDPVVIPTTTPTDAIAIPQDQSGVKTLLTGDINGDNAIDIKDYNLWLKTFQDHCVNTIGSLSSACMSDMTFTENGKTIKLYDDKLGLYSDVNNDGLIDGIDYNLMIKRMPHIGISGVINLN